MIETLTSLEDTGEFEAVQFDRLAARYDISTIKLRSPHSLLELDIIFNANDENYVPYYSLRWPTELNREEVVEVVRNVAVSLKDTKFVCLPASASGISWVGELPAHMEKENDEISGISNNLDRVLTKDFTLLRVDGEGFALVWEELDEDTQDGHPSGFAVLGDVPITDDRIMSIVAHTLVANEAAGVRAQLATLQSAFAKYAYAS